MNKHLNALSAAEKKLLHNALVEYKNTLGQTLTKIHADPTGWDEKELIIDSFKNEQEQATQLLNQLRETMDNPGYVSRVQIQNYWI